MAEKRIRAKAVTEQNFYDIFGDWPAQDQANALKVLEQIHRQTARAEEKRKPAEPQPCTFCEVINGVHLANCPNHKKPAPVQETLIPDAPICVKCGAAHGPEQPSCLAAVK